ncbi:MAG: bifunctional precorrin-2 dehydrogenase/sirohydrochlorin ferrochelatase [Dehalococcoidia bacterium]
MGYYPIFLEVEALPVVLVGGGHVALEKIGRLVDAGADVTVVAPELIPEVRAFIDAGHAKWLARPFEPGDTAGSGLVMVATDDGEVNRGVAEEARRNGILVNAADDVANCDFILPSLAKRGGLQIASSTGGGSPAMARWLRERLEDFLSDDVIALADLLAETRVEIRAMDRECAARCPRTKTPPPLLCEDCPNRIPVDRWQDAINGGVYDLVREGRIDEARALLKARLDRSELTPAPWWDAPAPAAEERVR